MRDRARRALLVHSATRSFARFPAAASGLRAAYERPTSGLLDERPARRSSGLRAACRRLAARERRAHRAALAHPCALLHDGGVRRRVALACAAMREPPRAIRGQERKRAGSSSSLDSRLTRTSQVGIV